MLKIINKEHYEQVTQKATQNKSIRALEEKLTYLNEYACTFLDPEETIVELGWDFAGFSILWKRRGVDGVYREWMHGGLIYHAADNSWSVHT